MSQRKKQQVTASVGWDYNGRTENAIWNLVQTFNTMKIAEAWTDWHLKNNDKGYDIGNYYHADSLDQEELPDEEIERQIEILKGMSQ